MYDVRGTKECTMYGVRCISSRALRGSCGAGAKPNFLKQRVGLEGMRRSRLLHLAVLYAAAILLRQNRRFAERGRRVAHQFMRA